jgi:2-keto-4-pentenoate hydratase
MTPVSFIQAAMRKDADFEPANASDGAAAGASAISEAFVWARLAGVKLEGFPGSIPGSLVEAYGVQDAAISRWPDDIVGWKVGWIAPSQRDASGDGRLVGPVFRGDLRTTSDELDIVTFAVFDGGFAAVEAEFVFRIARDAEPGRMRYSSDDAAALVGALHVGVETAGSPLATINELGPTVVVSDFGNNAGLILGPEVRDWRARDWASLTCETFVEGKSVGRGSAAAVENGPLDSLAFALGRLAARGRPLKAGDYVTTGAVTGIHDIVAGQEAAVVFDGIVTIRCRAVRAGSRA